MCMVSLPFLTIHIADLLSNIMRGACFENTYVSLFRNSSFSILKFARAITSVFAVFYYLSALDLATGPGTCVQ